MMIAKVSRLVNDDLFPVQRSILDGNALVERLLTHYALPQPITCRLYSSYANDIYQVFAGTERFWLRIYKHNEFSSVEIEAEIAILNQLAAAQAPVTRLVCSRAGKFVYAVQAPEGIRYCLLTAHAPDQGPGREITSTQAEQYGQAVAQLHHTLDQLPGRYHRPQLDLTTLLDEPLVILQPVLVTRPADWRFLGQIAEQLRSVLAALPTTLPVYGLCHGDLHKMNVLIDPTGQLTIIDWDCLGYGWRAYDLAVLRWSIGPAMGGEGIGEPRLSQVWAAYLQSYQGSRPLTTQEQAALPYFVALRQIRVLGWDVQRALDGRLGAWLLTDHYFEHQISELRNWMEAHCTVA
jgi:Ser/Thr protein kinase RdoA (MazF antagonist)